MSYFKVCPHCGAHLDPGEACTDCREKEKTPADAANTDEGKGGKQSLPDTDSTSHDN